MKSDWSANLVLGLKIFQIHFLITVLLKEVDNLFMSLKIVAEKLYTIPIVWERTSIGFRVNLEEKDHFVCL